MWRLFSLLTDLLTYIYIYIQYTIGDLSLQYNEEAMPERTARGERYLEPYESLAI